MGKMVAALSIASSGVLVLLALANTWLIAFHLWQRKRMIAQEQSPGRQILLHDQDYPSVCVQLAIRNEENVIRDAMRSLCALDWPKDRIEIMILDDQSTDKTKSIALEEASVWSAGGGNIRVISRPHRASKGGVLREGLALTNAAYFAIFDADYRPSPAFLKQTMPILIADPDLAFVQARIDFANRDTNWVTKGQAIELDTYYAFDQATRNWAGIPTAYNGTCAVWRRKAIEDAGGWTSRSFLEDVDLSFRAFARGWRAKFLTRISVPGELPQSIPDLVVQRLRWRIGWHEQVEVLPWRLFWRLKWHQTLLFLLLFAFDSASHVLVAVDAVLTVLAIAIEQQAAFYPLAGFLIAVGSIVLTKSVGSFLATWHCQRPITIGTVSDLAKMWAIQILLLPSACRAVMSTLLRRKRRFEPTPKTGVGPRA